MKNNEGIELIDLCCPNFEISFNNFSDFSLKEFIGKGEIIPQKIKVEGKVYKLGMSTYISYSRPNDDLLFIFKLIYLDSYKKFKIIPFKIISNKTSGEDND